ncbi:transmembrane protein C1orf162 homolog isoform X2 [Macrotis lagotis]
MPDYKILDFNRIYPYLLVAFVAGILLTLLIIAVICLIKKCCQKGRTRHSQNISKTSNPSHKSCPTVEDTQTCADTSLQDSKENSAYFVKHQDEESNPIVYAEIKVQTKTSLSTTESQEIC